MSKLYISTLLFFLFSFSVIYAQEEVYNKDILSLEDVIALAKDFSPDALLAKHTFRSSYWQFRSYRAGLLPNLSMNSTLPYLNRTMDNVTQPDGSETFVYRNTMNTSVSAAISQNVALTGGTLSISSNLQRIDQFGKDQNHQYMATPLSISFNQPINGYNVFRWQKKTEPLKYEKAKKEYLTTMEDIAVKAINAFFSFATAQLNHDISMVNHQNADTLYKLGKGRFNIGTIAEDELLQLELSMITSKIEVKKSELQLLQAKSQLINFLGFDKNSAVRLKIPKSVPELQIDYNQTLQLAYENNPQIIAQKLQMIEAEQAFASQKSEMGFQADLNMSFNLNQSAEKFEEVYKNPEDGQVIQLGLSIPILDWGKRKGQYKMAQSNMEVTKSNLEQAKLQFEQNVFNEVMECNFQNEQYIAACKSDTIAQLRYYISKKRYLINKITILELNTALTQRDASQRSYLSSIQSFWTSYYAMRKLTLFDFIENKKLDTDYDAIIE